MRKTKSYVFALLVIMTVMCLSACGSNKEIDNGQTTATTSAMETTPYTTESTTESTGVIDGMINDVEKGMETK